jgi:hypothetical protein
MVRDRPRYRPALWLALLATLALGTAPTVSRVLAAERGAGPLTAVCTAGGWRLVVLATGAADRTTGTMAGGHEDCALCLVAAPLLPAAGARHLPAPVVVATAPQPRPAVAASRAPAFALAKPRGPPGAWTRGA